MINTAAALVDAARAAASNGDYVSRDAIYAALDDGDDPLAKQLLDEHLHEFPNDTWMLAERARIAESPEAALVDLNRALEIEPDYAPTLAKRALVLLELGRASEAEKDHEQADRLSAEDPPDSWTRRLLEHFRYNREDAELEPIRRALEARESELATRMLDEHLCKYPDNWIAFAWRAHLSESPEDALRDLNTALEKAPDDAWCLVSRGVTLFTLGRDTDAERDFNKAIALEPELAIGRTSRAYFLLESGRIQEALSDIKQALRIEPDDGYTFSLLAHAAYLMGHFDKVLEHAARARANDYEASALTLDEADSLVRLGRAQEALALLEPLTEEDDPYVSLLCGIALTELKRPQEALAHLDDLDDPSTEHIRQLHRADCLLQLDRRDDVPNLLKQALDAAQDGHDSGIENGTYDLAWCHAFRALLSEQYGLGLDAAADRQRALALLREAVAIDPHNLLYAMPERAFAPMRNELQAIAATLGDDPA
jgi:tetratricopeptide (TPR) repeat protein